MEDILFDVEYRIAWRELLPGAEVIRLADAGHFVHEDAREETREALVEFLA